jgi:hypothetical protein
LRQLADIDSRLSFQAIHRPSVSRYSVIHCTEGRAMLYFIIGFFIGAYFGMTALALLYMARDP